MTKNYWGDLSNIEETRNPLDVLKEQSGYLLNATNNIIYSTVKQQSGVKSGVFDAEFGTVFSIRSKKMERYSFEVFTLFHNVTFFPMYAYIDENIAETLNLGGNRVEIYDEVEFHQFLDDMLGNDHTKNVIASLYAMSK
ncbi:hypothetical protein [Bacillus toyonensis]|uniref:hypothetical protein n=1 Tax=Bacillus toyonensis TaxID=155322 RepID=UPI002E1FEFC2|nr:hypothetical protein [Bacillus toyonensis]HDR7661070.1 hypothetical protein [Bacillus wiedmannii]